VRLPETVVGWREPAQDQARALGGNLLDVACDVFLCTISLIPCKPLQHLFCLPANVACPHRHDMVLELVFEVEHQANRAETLR
jgi:hypothetical protein